MANQIPLLHVLLRILRVTVLRCTCPLHVPRCEDETEEFLRLSIDPDNHIPVIHLHFNDDLTEVGVWRPTSKGQHPPTSLLCFC